MIARHIHDALGQVRRLQQIILERRGFRGYSGHARILSGAVALTAAAIMATPNYPRTCEAQLAGWVVVLTIALLVNYGALAVWFLLDPEVRRDPRELTPALDAVPALAVGGLLSLALSFWKDYGLLFGVWMCMYGLAQMSYRLSLPRGVYLVGLGYVICGAVCLFADWVSFLNPLPMGLVFFAGEAVGGTILTRHNRRLAEGEADPAACQEKGTVE